MAAEPILVTGAAGFIGFHVARRLAESGRGVVGIDNLNTYYDPALKRARLAELARCDAFRFQKLDLKDRDGVAALFAEPVAASHVKSHLEFEIQPLAWPEARRRTGLAGRPLAKRPSDGAPTDLHGGRTTMIGDRHPLIVRGKRIFRRQQGAGRPRMTDAGIKIRVVGDLRWETRRATLQRHQQIGRMLPHELAAAPPIQHIGCDTP